MTNERKIDSAATTRLSDFFGLHMLLNGEVRARRCYDFRLSETDAEVLRELDGMATGAQCVRETNEVITD